MKPTRRLFAIVLVLAMLLTNSGMTALAEAVLNMPAALQIIDEEAFYGSTSIDKVVLSDKVTEIRARAYANSTLSEINLPDSITFIAEDAFDGPDKVTVTANEGSWAYNWAVEHNYITPGSDMYSVAVSVSKDQSAVGESVTWTATAQNGVEPYKYRFYVYKGSTRKATRAYNASPDYTYTFTESGDYYVSVTCRDEDGETVTVDGGNVHVAEMAITGLAVTSDVTECINDTPVTFTATFEGGTAPFEYEFTLYRGATFVATSGKITDPEYTFTPDEAGLYTVTVKVNDATGAEFTATSDTLTVAGTELAIISVSANADWIRTGEDITWTAVATGGKKPLRYAFDIMIDGEEMDGTSFSTSNTTTWTTDTAGVYTVNARVRDADNVRVELVGGEVNVYDPLTLNSVTSDVTACKASEDITWTVDREGGKNTVTYEYTVQLNGETVYTKTSVNPKLIYTPMRTGTYTLTVTATDEAEDTATATSSMVAVSEHETSSVEDFTFKVLNGTYCSITGYTGSDTSLFLPLDDGNGHKVQTIAANAFKGKNTIENIVFSIRIDSIASSAFEGCTGLTFLDMGNSSVETIAVNAFKGCTNLTDVILPDDLTTIGACAFANCTSLESIVLPDSISTLYNDVFYGCAKLTTVNFPLDWVTKGHNSSTYLRDNYLYNSDYGVGSGYGRYSPFTNCVKLTKLVVPEGVTKIPDAAFLGMTSLKEIQLPSTLGIVGNGAFALCSGLTVLNLPRDMATINQYAFRGCTGLTAVNFNETIATIGTYAFYGCTGLVNIQLPISVRTMNSYAFAGCTGLTSVQFSTGLNSISEGAFDRCTNLTEIELPSQIKAINNAAFENCSRLVCLRIYGVETIGTNAFKGCSKLNDIGLPDSLTTIGACAFANCISLESIVLPDSISTLYNDVFYGCAKLTTVNFPLDWVTKGHNSSTYLRDNYLYNSDYGVGSGYGRYSPFTNCVKLTKLVVPEGVTKIPDAAFLGMTSLKEIQLPSTLRTIGQAAFVNCTAMLSIYISPDVSSIGSYAFKGRTSDFTIHGKAESYAETYATNNNIPFSTDPLPESTVVLSGKVLTSDSTGISSVTVKLYLDRYTSGTPITTTTDANGIWSYAKAKPGHDYVVTFAHSDYRFNMDKVTVSVQTTNTSAQNIIAYTDSAPTIMLSGQVLDPENRGIQDIDITIVDEDTAALIGSTVTVSGGRWKASIPNVGSNVKVSYQSPNYLLNPTSATAVANQDVTFDNVAATLIQSNTGEVSFSIMNTDESVVVGSTALFEVNAIGEKVRLIVDGVVYEEYPLSSGSTAVRRVFSKAGERNVQFQVYVDGEWGAVSTSQILNVISTGTLAQPSFEMSDAHILGMPLSVEWTSVDKASYYVIYLYTPNGILGPFRIEADNENGLTYTFDSSTFECKGQYVLEVISCGYGYSQNSYSKLFEVEPVTPSLVIVNPTKGDAFDEGNLFEFRVSNPNQRYIKLKITKLDDGSVKYYPDEGLVNETEYVVLDTFAAPGDYKFEAFGFISDNDIGDYNAPDAPFPVTISVAPSNFTDVSIGNGKGNQLITTDGSISFTAKGNTSIIKVEVYEGETLLKTVEDYAVDKTGKWRNVFSDRISVTTEGKHRFRFVATDTNGATHERSFTYYAITAISNGDTLYPIEGRDDLYLRTYPDAENKSITNGKIDADGSVKVLGSYGDSYYVQYNEKFGYVYKNGDVYQYSQATRQSAKPGIYAHGSFLGEPYIHSYSAEDANNTIWACEFQWGQVPAGAYAISGFVPNEVSTHDEMSYLTARNELDQVAMIDVSCKNGDCVFTGNSKDYRAVIRVYCKEGYLLVRSIVVVTIYANEKEYKYQTNQQIPTENMEYVSSLITDNTLRAHFDSWRNADNNPYNEGYLLQEFTYDAMHKNGLSENSLAWKAKDALWGLSSLGLGTIWGWIKDYISGNKNVREYKTLLDNVYLEYVQTVMDKSTNFLKDWKDVKGLYDEVYNYSKLYLDSADQIELDNIVGGKDFITVKDWLELSDYAKSKGITKFTDEGEKFDRTIRAHRNMGRINAAGQIIYKGINLVIDANNFRADKTLFLIELAKAPDEFIKSLESIRDSTTDTDLQNAIEKFLNDYKAAVKGSIESYVNTCLLADNWDTITNIGISITNYISGFTDKVGKLNTSAGSILDKAFGKVLKTGNAFSNAQSIMGTTVFLTDLVLDTTEIQNVTFKVSKSYQYKQALNVAITNDLATYSTNPSQELADQIVGEINMLKSSMYVGENYARDMYFQVIDSNYERARLNDTMIVQSYGVAGAWMGVDKKLSEQTKEWYEKQKKGFDDIVAINKLTIESFYVPKG